MRSSQVAVLDTDAATLQVDGGAAVPLASGVASQSNGPELLIVSVSEFTVEAGGRLSAIGSRPLAVLSFGGANISGELLLTTSARGVAAGANSTACAGGAGTHGAVQTTTSTMQDAGSGGGGGGFGDSGGAGAAIPASDGPASAGGIPNGSTDNRPLRGGCPGGNGGSEGGTGGSGGGAVQLTVKGGIFVGAAGIIAAAGSGGTSATGTGSGGGGGGSGGAVLLESQSITIAGFVTAHGGGGSGGSRSFSFSDPGEDGHTTDGLPATGGGPLGAGAGGDGAAGETGAQPGQSGFPEPSAGVGGGGGGGGNGRIHLRSTEGNPAITGLVSPAPE